jgi:hypothetical protein
VAPGEDVNLAGGHGLPYDEQHTVGVAGRNRAQAVRNVTASAACPRWPVPGGGAIGPAWLVPGVYLWLPLWSAGPPLAPGIRWLRDLSPELAD